uniref:Uncharacterized protein n=1 Tax=Anopheles merus TaxID=30066 RepID=A0A182V6W0_ANOME
MSNRQRLVDGRILPKAEDVLAGEWGLMRPLPRPPDLWLPLPTPPCVRLPPDAPIPPPIPPLEPAAVTRADDAAAGCGNTFGCFTLETVMGSIELRSQGTLPGNRDTVVR